MIQPPHRAFNISFLGVQQEDQEEEKEMISSMLSNNKVHMLYDALGQEILPTPKPSEKKKSKEEENLLSTFTDVVEDKATVVEEEEEEGEEEIKNVHDLFSYYLGSDYLDKLRLDYDELYALFCERAKPLKDEVEEDKEIIKEVIDSFIRRIVLNLLVHDKLCAKTRVEMVDRIEGLYDHRVSNGEPIKKVKNDFAHYDYINGIISARCKEARDPKTDRINIRFSEHKKRGRHPKQRAEEVTNEIETIAGEYIAKRLGLLQAAAALAANNTHATTVKEQQRTSGIDYYPTFQDILETCNKSIPKENNHGFYTKRLLHLIRALKDSRVWPLHGLMSVAHNLNYFIHADTVKMNFDRTKRRFYCCFSGLEIIDGETVTCLRLVENDAERLKEWRDSPMMIGKPFKAPEFTRSVYAFYMKKELCCASTLFFTPFSEKYKAAFPEYFDERDKRKTKNTPAPTKKKRVVNPKRKASEEKPDTKKRPKLEVKKEAEMEVEDTFFESLSTRATKKPLFMASLRHCMASLSHVMPKEYEQLRTTAFQIFDCISKRSFVSDMQGVIFTAIMTLNNNLDEDAVLLCVAECYTAMFAFTEALVAPEFTLSHYGSAQTNLTMRALFHAARQHAKERTPEGENPFKQVCTTEDLLLIEPLKKCPLFFILLFNYMAEKDTLTHLKPCEPLIEKEECLHMLSHFKL